MVQAVWRHELSQLAAAKTHSDGSSAMETLGLS